MFVVKSKFAGKFFCPTIGNVFVAFRQLDGCKNFCSVFDREGYGFFRTICTYDLSGVFNCFPVCNNRNVCFYGCVFRPSQPGPSQSRLTQ